MTVDKRFSLRRAVSAFQSDEEGSLSVELCLILPILFVWWVASIVFVDYFRVATANERAAYAIADMVARQTNPIDDNYIDGLNTALDFLVYSNTNNKLRVTSILFDVPDGEPVENGEYYAEWSKGTRGMPDLTNADVQAMESRIPIMPDGETVILVETFLDYTPIWNQVGLSPRTMGTFIIMRPRFQTNIEYTS